MYKKYCHKCSSYSYSASIVGDWICSKCGADLQDERKECNIIKNTA